MHDRAGYTPYEGRTVTGWPVTVLSRGRVVVEDGNAARRAGLRPLPRPRGRRRRRAHRPPRARVRSGAEFRGAHLSRVRAGRSSHSNIRSDARSGRRTLPLPACGERVGVRGRCRDSEPKRCSTDAQTRGEAPSPGSLARSDLSPHAGRGNPSAHHKRRRRLPPAGRRSTLMHGQLRSMSRGAGNRVNGST